MLGALVLLWVLAGTALVAWTFRRELARAWREPVLASPVLVIESDDWGYGPVEQAGALARIAALLGEHRDRDGHPAVMTLGVVLAGPDTARIAADGCRSYHRIALDDPRLGAVRAAMQDGAARGVFALQLHGMEHYWPPLLLAAAQSDDRLRAWLTDAALPSTEALPSPLQSRWIDASTLPSRPLAPEAIERAAADEAHAFRAVFSAEPDVVVPPTFVWTPAVEQAWARAGVRWLVTPGQRFESRGADGQPVAGDARFDNGERAPSGLIYIVRDRYFEPALGHTAERGLAALREKTQCGQPTLLETHRFNFVGDAAQSERAASELDRLLGAARRSFASLKFMSTAELGRSYRDGGPLVDRRLAPRLHCLVSRLARNTRLRKLAWLTGLAVPAALVWSVTRTSRGAAA